jgi:pimeloyl-ACP methyl ester carboxylesterase
MRLAVAVVPAKSDDPSTDPLLMLAGGPGESALSAFIPLLALPGFDALWADRDIVLIEQRGTKYSAPFLQCANMLSVKLEIMAQNLHKEEEDALRLHAWELCRDEFLASGVDLAAYNSLENAADVMAVADALGYDQVNLFGGSYGSLLAQHVMRDYSKRVRAAILSDISPLEHAPNMLYKAHSMDRSLRLLFQQCAADEACSQAYPDLENVYWSLISQLDETPATLQIVDPNTGASHDLILTGDRLVALTRNLLYITALLPDLPGAIYDMAEGDFSLLELIEARFLFGLDLADGMYTSVVCAELADFEAFEQADIEGLYPPVVKVIEDLLDEVMLQPCPVWGVELLGDALDQSLVADIPTLMLSGEFDPTVPPRLAQIAAKGLDNAYLYTFPGTGHGALTGSDCARAMAVDFLADPSRAPDTACLEAMPGLAFRIANTELALERFVDKERGFRGLVPAGWQSLAPANMVRANSATDPTYYVLAAEPGTAADMYARLAGQLGLDPAAEPTGEAELGSLTWSLYRSEMKGFPIDLALAEDDAKAYFILLISPADEHQALYEQLFLPAVEAMEPL